MKYLAMTCLTLFVLSGFSLTSIPEASAKGASGNKMSGYDSTHGKGKCVPGQCKTFKKKKN
jgi:hypothetical protein